ncbi:MAG: TOBE domain-containing protein [Synergistaceae bacterium]|nr:TOBE domain-containing protein [Synergistaceae bacterium]
MKSSARNYYHGAVLNVFPGSVSDEIEIVLDNSNARMTAIISSTNVKTLGLEPGKKVVVLIKAHWVILVDNSDGTKFSSRNQLPGTVVSVKESALEAEVNLRLDCGEPMSVIVSSSSLKDMGIEAGMRLTALFKASNVIVGIKR